MNFAPVRTDAMTEHALARLCLSSGAVVHIEITDRMDVAEPAWRELCAQGNFATAYQNYDFCALWLRHVGAPSGAKPFIVIGRDDDGSAVFLWPLVRRKLGPLQVATYFCDSHANFRTALWRGDIAASVTAADMRAITKEISGNGVDTLVLLSQPERLNDVANPMRFLPSQASASSAYGVHLAGSGAEILERQLNPDSRRKLRRKERNLAKLPGFRYHRASTREEVDRYFSAFMAQKAARLEARGIKNAFAEQGVEGFLRAACLTGLSGGEPLLEIHVLECDGDVLALFAGVHDRTCFSTMFNSYTLTEQSRWSPGFILLLKLVEDCAGRGFKTLDLGVGAAEYKSLLCDIEARQFDSFVGLSPQGRMLALALRTAYSAKGVIKRNPALWNFASQVRAKLKAPKAKA